MVGGRARVLYSWLNLPFWGPQTPKMAAVLENLRRLVIADMVPQHYWTFLPQKQNPRGFYSLVHCLKHQVQFLCFVGWNSVVLRTKHKASYMQGHHFLSCTTGLYPELQAWLFQGDLKKLKIKKKSVPVSHEETDFNDKWRRYKAKQFPLPRKLEIIKPVTASLRCDRDRTKLVSRFRDIFPWHSMKDKCGSLFWAGEVDLLSHPLFTRCDNCTTQLRFDESLRLTI